MRAVLNQHFKKIGISYNIRLRRSESKVTPEIGNAYLQFIQQRKCVRVALGIVWPIDRFDHSRNLFLPRFAGDAEVNDRNLEVQQCISKVSDLMVQYRLGNTEVSLEKVLRDYQSFASRHSVSSYIEKKAHELFNDGLVMKETYAHYKLFISRLKKFEVSTGSALLFSDLNGNTGNKLYRFARERLKLAHNTSVGIVKHYKNF